MHAKVVPPQPVDAPVDAVLVFRAGPIAAVDPDAGDLGIGLVQDVAGNHQRGNAGTGHAAGARVELGVAPGAVVLVLVVDPIGADAFPCIGVDGDTDLAAFGRAAGLVQGQHRELAVRRVAGEGPRAGIEPYDQPPLKSAGPLLI